jgi:hypothetical protein
LQIEKPFTMRRYAWDKSTGKLDPTPQAKANVAVGIFRNRASNPVVQATSEDATEAILWEVKGSNARKFLLHAGHVPFAASKHAMYAIDDTIWYHSVTGNSETVTSHGQDVEFLECLKLLLLQPPKCNCRVTQTIAFGPCQLEEKAMPLHV